MSRTPRRPWSFSCLCLLLGGLGVALSACGGKPSGGNNNQVIWCDGDEQCPAGMVCEGNACVSPADGGTTDADVRTPDIALSDQTLDFQSPLLGSEVVLPLTIYNVGDADLLVTQIVVDEPGSLQEFHVDQEGAVQITIPPGGEHTLQVSLLSIDAELDTGALRIFSNDPDENPVVVNLVSEYKGTADVNVCVFTEDATPPYPGHPFSGCAEDAQGHPVVDYGLVRFEEAQERTFVLWNAAVGNAPLMIESIQISNSSGNANTYTLTTFVQDPGTGDASPAALPHYLSAGDPVNSVAPDLLYVTVQFDATVDFFPTEQIEVLTNDPDSGQVFIDVIGVVSGCPDDYWDIDLTVEGCEYYCVFQQTTESCASVGVDDNCNGEVDEEDADGCTVYYRDHDGDTYGAIGDFRCLCAPEGEYDTTVGLDCDDDDIFVKPGVVERCITPYDDNCDGSDNDLNAQGCVNYLRDEDGDGYGVTGDSRCLCYADGYYSTTTSGDCDDNPAACGAGCNPGRAEDCSTAADDNCSGDANEQNAPGCINYYRDFDGDGYGHSSDYQCWCSPRGLYTASQPTDCNDNAVAINPAATEVCDSVDNNCVGGVDEGFNLQTDVSHCGSCNHACLNPHGTAQCVGGLCEPTCDPGWGNCNGIKDDGCETNLNTALYCGTCSNHGDCPSNFFCNATTCEKKWTNGTMCSGDVQCQTGYCRDGVCCNTNCGGVTADCQACNLAGNLGSCTSRPASTDPENACSLEAASTCGQNGFCDGGGSCALYSTSTVCQVATCVSGVFYSQDVCDGFGTCQDSGTVPCGAYTCNAGGTACRSSCTGAADCATGYFCNGSNQCVPTTPTGTPCTLDSQCGTNMCRDGYCCNSDCSGSCRACNKVGLQGTCSYHANNTDPENNCPTCQVCNGSGSCVNVAEGQDPLSECTASAASTCGLRGDCSGSGACARWPNGTACTATACSNSTLYPADTCTALGICSDSGSAPCAGNLTCADSTSCRTSCSLDTHCRTGYYCASGSCQPKKSTGNTCGGTNECTSGFCVDGYCCNNACSGDCKSCAISGSAGTCSNYTTGTDPENNCQACQMCSGGSCVNAAAGTDPLNDCPNDGVSSCDRTGVCNGGGACALYPSGTVCLSQTCIGTTKYYNDTCNGSGTCNDGGTVSCAPYACDTSNDCRSFCVNDTHCFTNNFCMTGTCCAPVTTDSGSTCGSGTLGTTLVQNNTTPAIRDYSGNIVPATAVRWYRFTAQEAADDLNVWIWFTNNPSGAYRFEVWSERGTDTSCVGAIKATGDSGCSGEYTQYRWYHGGWSPWTSNDTTTFFVKVYRTTLAPNPSCANYSLRVKVGGTAVPW